MINPWQIEEDKTIYQEGIVSFKESLCYHQDKKIFHSFFKMEFLDWVNVVAITESGQLILVEQYRFGTNQSTLEIPGGTLDDGEKENSLAARRELLEETGYSSNQLIELGRVAVNPAIQNNYCYFYLAEDAKYLQKQDLDLTEDIEVLLIDWKKVNQYIDCGKITHSLSILALLKAKEYFNNKKIK